MCRVSLISRPSSLQEERPLHVLDLHKMANTVAVQRHSISAALSCTSHSDLLAPSEL